MSLNSHSIRDFIIIIVGLAMIVLMSSIRAEQEAAQQRGETRDQMLCQIARENSLTLPRPCEEVLKDAGSKEDSARRSADS